VVLRPIDELQASVAASHRCVPAFGAVEARQMQPSSEWWLIAQPDHAALAGDLAAAFAWGGFPKLGRDVLQAIALHDAGWAHFDNGASERDRGDAAPKKRPVSFLEIGPVNFLRAWLQSIERAEQSSAIGGVLVSEHFSRLASSRLQRGGDEPRDVVRLQEFLSKEESRRQALGRAVTYSQAEIRRLVDVLQFCDLLSLYLCSGPRETVEFPQQFSGETIRVSRDGDYYRSKPAIFGSGVSLGVCARRYPHLPAGLNGATIPFLLS